MQGDNVTAGLFYSGHDGLPLRQPDQEDLELLGRVLAGRSSGTGSGGGRRPIIRTSTPASSTSSIRTKRRICCQQLDRGAARRHRSLRRITYDQLDDVQNCLQNDKTLIKNLSVEVQLPVERARTSSSTCSRATTSSATPAAPARTRPRKPSPSRRSDEPWGFPLPTHSLTHTLIAHRPAGVQQPVHLRARRLLPGLPGQLLDEGSAAATRATWATPTTTTT